MKVHIDGLEDQGGQGNHFCGSEGSQGGIQGKNLEAGTHEGMLLTGLLLASLACFSRESL